MGDNECEGCGLSVYDLPDEAGDPELVRETFFEFDQQGNLYCRGCAA